MGEVVEWPVAEDYPPGRNLSSPSRALAVPRLQCLAAPSPMGQRIDFC
jgi:hypothetical protein